MITKALSSKLVLLVIGLAAGSGILIPAGYASFHPVTSSEIQNETILSVDIKNGEVKTDDIAPSAIGSLRIKDNDVKAQDIAPDAVGASEIAGVTKLIFAECSFTNNTPAAYTSVFLATCSVPGSAVGNSVIATHNPTGGSCYIVGGARVSGTDAVQVRMVQDCEGISSALGTANFSIVVFDT